MKCRSRGGLVVLLTVSQAEDSGVKFQLASLSFPKFMYELFFAICHVFYGEEEHCEDTCTACGVIQ